MHIINTVAQVSEMWERRECGYEYWMRLEVSPKFAVNDRLGTSIIYIKKCKRNNN